VFHTLRRTRWPIAAGVCVGALAALVTVRLTTPRVFAAQSAVAVDLDELPEVLRRGPGEIDFWNLRVALLSDAILHEVIVRAFPIPPNPTVEHRLADAIRSRLTLRYIPRKRWLAFGYRDSDPVRAAEVVNLFARFFGEEDIEYVAAPSSVPVAPRLEDYLTLGIVGGLLGGLLVFLGCVLSRVAVERFAREH
jgi:uncharacterized protein involved in exopolysaccharide biosynthesis